MKLGNARTRTSVRSHEQVQAQPHLINRCGSVICRLEQGSTALYVHTAKYIGLLRPLPAPRHTPMPSANATLKRMHRSIYRTTAPSPSNAQIESSNILTLISNYIRPRSPVSADSHLHRLLHTRFVSIILTPTHPPLSLSLSLSYG